MSKLDYSKIFVKGACPTSIGGQAIMEGVMMQGPDRMAMAMRLPSGEFYLKTKKKPIASKWSKIPMIRGCVNFFTSLISGTEVLMDSADVLEKYAPEEFGEKSKFEKWFEEKFGGDALWNVLMVLSVIIALAISIAVFVILPTIVVNWMKGICANAFVLNLVEGLLRIAMFILYIVAIRQMKDIRTLFQYHGSEHKTIHCFENNLELTPENAQQFYTLHPRCGTSFLVFVFIIALILFSFLGWPNLAIRIASRLLLLPVIAGISYELLKWAGRSDGKLVKILSYPGLMLQKLTTAEPSNDQLEVAIISLKAVLVDPETPVGEGFCDKDGNWLPDFDEKDFIEPAEDKVVSDTTYENALRWGEMQLVRVENGKNEAMMIFDHVTGFSRADIIIHGKDLMDSEKLKDYYKRIKVRLKGVPLQYILGEQQFMGLPFRVNKHVLIPRMDTEVLVESAVKLIEKKGWENPQVLDMCTGSGAIGVSVAHLVPSAVVTMTDVSEKAISVADYNAHNNGVSRRCIFQVGDMFKALSRGSKYDVFICNPPYIETKVIETLQTEVKNYEPRLALDGGKDGLDFYRRIADEAGRFIRHGGILALEIGDKQARAVKKLLDESENYGKTVIIKDLAGLDRVIIAERK